MLLCSEIFICYKESYISTSFVVAAKGYSPNLKLKSFHEGGIISNLWLVI